VTAAALAGSRASETGLRRTDPRRDLAGVARLVQTAFAGQLDGSGQRMLRDMRWLGRAGWLGWLLGRVVLPPGATPDGFVWLESGRVVGNLSLLPVDGDPNRWVIANVAVDPDQRRRGIGRSLVQAAIELAGQRRARTVALQVDRANQAARELYLSLGFRVTSTRTNWIRPRGLPRPQMIALEGLRPRSFPEWREQWELGKRLLPDGFWWPFLPDERIFRGSGVSAAIGMNWTHHWVWKLHDVMLASISAHARLTAGFRFLLLMDTQHRGSAEKAMLARALAELPEGSGGTLEYATGEAESDFWELGFRPDRSLTWMALDLQGRGLSVASKTDARMDI
jgi:ribosomal protein S18 acetylase RimI-like enzyme